MTNAHHKDLAQALTDLKTMLGRPPEHRLCRLTPTTEIAVTAEAALASLCDVTGMAVGDGWLETTGHAGMVARGETLPSDTRPLAAELVIDARASLHLRRAPSGWLATTWREEPVDTDAGDMANHIAETRSVLVRQDHHAKAFVYHVFWAFDPAGALRPVASRLAAVRRHDDVAGPLASASHPDPGAPTCP